MGKSTRPLRVRAREDERSYAARDELISIQTLKEREHTVQTLRRISIEKATLSRRGGDLNIKIFRREAF